MTEQTESAAPFDFTKSPEFIAAVEERATSAAKIAADAAVEGILSKLQEAQGAAPKQGDNANWAEGLAMAIAQLNDQGSQRKHVAPEILAKRVAARTKMEELLISARADGRVPRYNLRNKIYLDEVLVDPIYVAPDKTQQPTEISWPGVPSEAMIPLNEIAIEVYALFEASIGSVDAKHRIKQEPLFTTAGGLVVSGRPTVSRMARNAPDALRAVERGAAVGEGLGIAHRGAPGQFNPTHVLGTVARPAMQTS